MYVSYTDIFKPQTERDASRKYLEPIVGSNYELGLKGSLLEERLNLATAVFWSKQDNVAELDSSVPPDPVTGEEFYKSGGKGGKVQGFEAEVSGKSSRAGTSPPATPTPMPWTAKSSAPTAVSR